MVEQTTKPNHGKTGSENVRPLILRSRENLYLIAETRTFITGFRDAVTLCSKMVDHVFQIMDDCLLTCMVPYYTNLLQEKINTGEAYLGKSQRNLDKLITIHPGYCADIHQVATSFSSCKERLQGVKERGKHFLPGPELGSGNGSPTPTLASLQPDSTPTQANKVNQVTEAETVPYKKRIKYKVAPQPPQTPAKDKRESTPAPRGGGRRRRRKPAKGGRRRRSNRILAHLPPATKPASSALFGPSELGNDHNNQLFPEDILPPATTHLGDQAELQGASSSSRVSESSCKKNSKSKICLFNESELPETATSPQIGEEVLNLSHIFGEQI